MSNKHWIKGMRRRAASRGFGRMGLRQSAAELAFVEQVERRLQQEKQREHAAASHAQVKLNEKARASALDREARQDAKRGKRKVSIKVKRRCHAQASTDAH